MQVQRKPSLRARSCHSRSEPTPFSSQKSERPRSTLEARAFPSSTASRPSGRSVGNNALRSTSSSVTVPPHIAHPPPSRSKCALALRRFLNEKNLQRFAHHAKSSCKWIGAAPAVARPLHDNSGPRLLFDFLRAFFGAV